MWVLLCPHAHQSQRPSTVWSQCRQRRKQSQLAFWWTRSLCWGNSPWIARSPADSIALFCLSRRVQKTVGGQASSNRRTLWFSRVGWGWSQGTCRLGWVGRRRGEVVLLWTCFPFPAEAAITSLASVTNTPPARRKICRLQRSLGASAEWNWLPPTSQGCSLAFA